MNMIPACPRLHVVRAGLPAILLLSLATAAPLQAQQGEYRISQRATISQKLGNTLISLDYSRPLARDRDDVFGKVVHWGELWTPGANEATVLEVSHDVKLNGHVVKPGRWSMWIIPSQVGPWELVLDARDSLFHTQRPELTDEQVRFVIDARQDAHHVEALTWSFPRIAQGGATLMLNWGALEVPLEVEVESIEPTTKVTAEEATMYVGEWRVEFEPMESGMTMPPTTLTVHYGDDGRLHATFPPGMMGPPPDTAADAAAAAAAAAEAQMTPQERERAQARRTLAAYETGEMKYVLVPRAPGVFLMGWVEDDVLLDAGFVYHEFEVENGRAVSLALRDDKDVVWGRAKRAN